MKIEIDIPDEKTENLSDPAESRLQSVIEKYSCDILDEASRIEATQNSGNDPEITATFIDDAVDFNKRFKTKKGNSTKKIIALIVAFISTVFTGGYFKPEEFNKPEYLWPFLVAFLISVITNFYIFLNDYKND